MSAVVPLGRLELVELRDAWPHEAINFTPWLAEEANLRMLGDAVGLELEFEAMEKPVEAFSADILAKDRISGTQVLIENQLGQTDHGHLGQLLTYAAGLSVNSVIWIARDFREPHRAALDWLNHVSSEAFNFFGVQVELYRIGTSAYAPRFNVVAKPNGWVKQIAAKAKDATAIGSHQQEWRDYWSSFFSVADARGLSLAHRTPPKEGWCRLVQLRSGDLSTAVWAHWSKQKLRTIVWMEGPYSGPLFSLLQEQRDALDEQVGLALTWDEMPTKKSCMIYASLDTKSLPSELDQFAWFAQTALKLVHVFKPAVGGVTMSDVEASANAGSLD